MLHLPLLAGAAPLRWLGDRVATPSGRPPGGPDVKGLVHGLVNRFGAPDAAGSVQMASSGGGRGPAVAALLSLCLGGGAGTYCVATGALPDPVRLVRQADPERKSRAQPPAKRDKEARAATTAPTPTATPLPARPVIITTGAAPRDEPAARTRAKREPERGSDPASEFGFEGATGTPGLAPPADPPSVTTASTTPPPTSGGGSTPSSSPPPTSGGEFLP